MPYSPDISVLTKEGWKPAPSITTKDEVASVDVSTGAQKWVKPKSIISFPYEGDALKFKHMSVETLVPLWKGIISRFSKSDIFEKSNIIDISPYQKIEFPDIGFQQEGCDVDHAYLIGWRSSTSANNKGYRGVTFLKSEGSKLDALIEYLENNDVSFYTRSTYNPDNVMVVHVTGNDEKYLENMSPDKFLPKDFLSWSLKSRQALFQGLTDAVEYEDFNDSSQNYMWTKEERRRDDMMALMSSIGIQSFSGRYGSGVIWVRYRKQKNKEAQRFSKETVPYKGEMWTMEIETGNWIARSKGKVFLATA